ncbi:MAG: hypothetical protein NUV61_03320 [Candidatus Azambacteria bacterium]|nr:hypothetical protein [Candidatus Azambacteria bacterium]
MSKKEGFDVLGLFFTVNELNRAFAIPLPSGLEHMGFCTFCLGANVPGQVANEKTQWCCGSWVDGLLPLLKICERFQVDKQRVTEVVKQIRPTHDSTASSRRVSSAAEVSLDIMGIVIRIPIV